MEMELRLSLERGAGALLAFDRQSHPCPIRLTLAGYTTLVRVCLVRNPTFTFQPKVIDRWLLIGLPLSRIHCNNIPTACHRLRLANYYIHPHPTFMSAALSVRSYNHRGPGKGVV